MIHCAARFGLKRHSWREAPRHSNGELLPVRGLGASPGRANEEKRQGMPAHRTWNLTVKLSCDPASRYLQHLTRPTSVLPLAHQRFHHACLTAFRDCDSHGSSARKSQHVLRRLIQGLVPDRLWNKATDSKKSELADFTEPFRDATKMPRHCI